MLEPAVLVLCKVGEAALGDLHQLLLHVQRRLVEQALRLQVGDAKNSSYVIRGHTLITSTQFSGFWTPSSPHVCNLARSTVLNPRKLPYYVCISLAPPQCRRHLSMVPNGCPYLIHPRIGYSRRKREIHRCNTCRPCIGKFQSWHTSLLYKRIDRTNPCIRCGSFPCILKIEMK